METYKTFLRSATNFEEFASADKVEMETGLTEEEAWAKCQEFNRNRDEGQINAGTKMEYTAE